MSWLKAHDLDQLAAYDQWVQSSPYGSFYQDRAWSKVKELWRSDYLLLKDDSGVVGGTAFRSINAANGKPFVYVSRGPVVDPNDVVTWRQVIDEARAYGEKIGAFFVRFDPLYPYSKTLEESFTALGLHVRSVRETVWDKMTQTPLNAVMHLGGKDEEEILAGLAGSKRRAIRNGMKNDPVFSTGRTEGHLLHFERMYQEMTDRKQIGRRPYDYFVRLMDAFPAAYFAEASLDGAPICSHLMLPYGQTMTYLYGASTAAVDRACIPDALHWQQIVEAKKHGYCLYDFGSVFQLDVSCGLYRFKHGYCKQEGITAYIGELDLVLDENAYAAFIGE